MAFDPLVVILLLFYLLFVVTLLILWFALKPRPKQEGDQDDTARASPKPKEGRKRAEPAPRKAARFAAPQKPEKTNLAIGLSEQEAKPQVLEQPPIPPREVSPAPIVREVVRAQSGWPTPPRDQDDPTSERLYQPSNDRYRGANAKRAPLKRAEPPAPPPPEPPPAESDEEEDAFERFINARNDDG